MLGLGHENLVARTERVALRPLHTQPGVRLADAERHRVQRVGRAGGPDDLLGRRRTHELGDGRTGTLEAHGRGADGLARAAVHGGVVVFEEGSLCVEHAFRPLRGRRSVEIGDRAAVEPRRVGEVREGRAQFGDFRIAERGADEGGFESRRAELWHTTILPLGGVVGCNAERGRDIPRGTRGGSTHCSRLIAAQIALLIAPGSLYAACAAREASATSSRPP